MANTVLTANVSPLIPFQFPAFYQEDYPNFVAFVQAYYQWLEQSGNAVYYARRIYDIEDIDNTFDQFIVYFKEKYLKNIQFNTATNIRTVIKHALDIYRSKGTERCTTLIFQLAFDESPDFYYPSVDLMKLSDGVWTIPIYLELSINWSIQSGLQQKEVQGAFSGATGFVDNIIQRFTNGKVQDIAYISAISGEFQTGEKIVPTDGSLPIANCPVMTGSLTSVLLPSSGSGNNYVVGGVIPVATINGNGAILLVTNAQNQSGALDMVFADGGYGYSFTQQQANISYTAATNSTGAFANGVNIYTYFANGTVDGIAVVNNSPAMVSNAGAMTVNVLTGNINYSTFYSYGNTANATANTANINIIALSPNVVISNATMTINNMTVNTPNNEYTHYFNWMDQLTQAMATYNYVGANGTFQPGTNVYIYANSTTLGGQGVIMEVNQTATSNGILVVSVTSGNVTPNSTVNAIFTSGNSIGANLLATNAYTNTTATANFLANATNVSVDLNITSETAAFVPGEPVFQIIGVSNTFILPGPQAAEKIGGYGIVYVGNSSFIELTNVVGKFVSGEIVGVQSGTRANVVSVEVTIGLINLSFNSFVSSPYGTITSPICNGYVESFALSGTGFNVTLSNTLLYAQTVSINYDLLSDYAGVALNATTYGFPSNPSANANTGTLLSCQNMLNTTIGRLSNVFVSGQAVNFTQVPFVVIDYAPVSGDNIHNDILQITGETGAFHVGEQVTQSATGAQGLVIANSNTSFVNLLRMSYANDFVPTTNSTTTIVGQKSGTTANVINSPSVDYDIAAQIMGRNAQVVVSYTTGNNVLVDVDVINSGFGFVNGELISIGSNGAFGTAVVAGQGMGSGYYLTQGGWASANKKLFDGYFYQNFSYQIISPILIQKYQDMLTSLTHVAGTVMFGDFVHNSQTNSPIGIENAVVTISG